MTQLQVYREKINKINNALTRILLDNVDEETGEIDESIIPKLDELNLTKQDLITVMALCYHEYNSLAANAKNDVAVIEAQRKLELAKKYESTSKSFKKLLSKYVPEGQVIETEDFRISWRKSSGVEFADLIDEEVYLQSLSETHPDLVKTVFTLKKKEAGELWKQTGTLPTGLKYNDSRQNIQIK